MTQADFQRGRKWRISLVNFSGGLASATVEFTFPAQPAQATVPAGGDLPRQATIEMNTDRPGEDYAHTPLGSPDIERCRRMCVDDLRCASYTLTQYDSVCHLKSGVPGPVPAGNCVSGVVVIRPLTMGQNTDRPGNGWDYDHRAVESSPDSCRLRCIQDPKCASYTYVHPGVNSASAECYLKSVAAAPVTNRSCCVSGVGFFRVATTEPRTDRPGQDYAHLPLPVRNPALCRLRCAGDSRCVAYTYTWNDGVCHLKSSIPQAIGNNGCCESGVVLRRDLTSVVNTDRPLQDYRSFELPERRACGLAGAVPHVLRGGLRVPRLRLQEAGLRRRQRDLLLEAGRARAGGERVLCHRRGVHTLTYWRRNGAIQFSEAVTLSGLTKE